MAEKKKYCENPINKELARGSVRAAMKDPEDYGTGKIGETRVGKSKFKNPLPRRFLEKREDE